MDLSNKLFHGINLGHYGSWIDDLKSTDVLNSILEYQTLYTRQKLNTFGYCDCLNPIYCQGINEVCLALHPNNTQLDIGRRYNNDDAYYDFVRYNISLIFDETLLTEKDYRISGMYREVRVTGSIELDENLIGIGYFDKAQDTLNKLEEILMYQDIEMFKKNKLLSNIQKLINSDNSLNTILDMKNDYFIIKSILNKLNISIPIIDTYTGLPINEDLDMQVEQAKEIKEKIKILTRNNI